MDEIKANLDHLSDLAVKFENSNINTSSTIYSFISYVEKISKNADSDSSTAKIIGENENVVRIMTIHKSKGLEFPVVFLCDTNTKYNFSDLIKPIVMHHSMGIGINYINDKFNITYPSIIKQGIKSLITKEIKSEELRMLYVALTRAKEKLIIFATISNYSKYINDMFVMYDNNRIDPIAIEQNDTYIKNIIMALKSDIIQGLNDNKLFKINVFNVYDNENKIINIDNEACVKDISLIEKLNSISKIKDAKYIDNKLALKIKKNIIDEYPYIIDTKTESRISVSKLKKQENEQNIKEIYADDKPNINSHSKTNMNEMNMIKPKCLSENTSQDYSLRKGVLVHFILETLDFNEDWNKQKLIDYIDSLHITGVISKEDKEKINIEDLCKFLNSKIYKDVTKLPQNMIRKEEQFILKSENISRSFIQGVIDLYYIKDSKITLVDFKTDRLKNEEDYILRYKKQLVIYKEALEKLTGYLVDNVYIYSFTLGKEIKLDI